MISTAATKLLERDDSTSGGATNNAASLYGGPDTQVPAALSERWLPTSGAGDFNNAANWSRHYVPNANTPVVLPTGNYTVNLTSNADVGSLSVGTGATLAMGANRTLQLENASTNRGTITFAEDSFIKGSGLTNYGNIQGNGTIYSLTNVGTVQASDLIIVRDSTNLATPGTLSGGKWMASSSGSGQSTLILVADTTISSLSGKAMVTVQGYDSYVSSYGLNDPDPATAVLQNTLTSIDAGSTLSLDRTSFTIGKSLDVSGSVLLAEGAYIGSQDPSTILTIEKGGVLSGDGYLDSFAQIYGTARTDGRLVLMGLHDTLHGTLSGTGTVQVPYELDVMSGARITAANLDVSGIISFQNTFTFSSHVLLRADGILQADGPRLNIGGVTDLFGGTIRGSGIVTNSGTLESSGGTIASRFVNNGAVNLDVGTLHVTGTASGTGTFTIHDGTTLEFGAAVGASAVVNFQGGTLLLDDAHDFHGLLTGLMSDDSFIDLSGFDHATARLSYKGDADGVGGILRVVSGTQTASLHFDENINNHAIIVADDGHGGTMLSYDHNDSSMTVHHDATLGF